MGDVETIWTRDTSWRQGHLLSREAFNKLELQKLNSSTDACAVVVSHDCDLANPNLEDEPDVEIIVGSFVAKLDGNYAHAKNPRTVHLEVKAGDQKKFISLTATKKIVVSKNSLAPFTPDVNYEFPSVALGALRTWLTIRYNRVAFPNAFNDRLNKVASKLKKLIEPSEKSLLSIYFDLNGDEAKELDANISYQLSIILVYYAKDDPTEAETKISPIRDQIEALMSKYYFDANAEVWNGIQLKVCMCISDEEITLSQERELQPWYLEHMTLKAEAAK